MGVVAVVVAGAAVDNRDRVGLGWRPELAASILLHRDRIDVVEVIAENYFDASAARRRALATLARQLPVYVHGVGLGAASVRPVDRGRLEELARLVGEVEPVGWSEHLAFVRSATVEIGHLAAPPRTSATIEGTLHNLAQMRRVVGSAPLMENVATLIDPPGSTLDEPEWLRAIVDGSDAPLLLDLHNLHANAYNFGFDAEAALRGLDLSRVGAIHLAGGKLVEGDTGESRLIDDHLHAVPRGVFTLLTTVATLAPQPLTVILERDGKYPPFAHLLAELDLARAALATGRLARHDPQAVRL